MKVALAVVAAVLVLVAGALALKPSWIAERLRGQLETIATRSLGRPVSVEKLEAHWLPRPGATLTNLRVEGEGNEPAFLEAPRATATVQLWPLLRSLGKDVRVGALNLDATKLNLVRHEDGTWNYESLGSTGPESERETFVEALRIRDGVVNVTDPQAAGGTAAVVLRDIDVELKGLGPGRALEGTLRAALAAPAQNVALDFEVDPLPAGKLRPGQPWPEVTMHLRAADLSVSAFRNFLPPEAASYFTGDRVDLTKKQPEWSLRVVLAGMDTAQAFQSLSGHPSLRGTASGELQLTGTGADWAQARNHVTGGGSVQLRDGALTTVDVGAKVTPILTQGFAVLGHKGAAGTVQKAEQGTRLKDLSAQVQDGWVAFTKPMAFQSDIGSGTLDGRVGLDERLELKGTINSSEQFVSAITHGALPTKAPVTIPLTITGTLSAPEVTPGSPLDIAKGSLPGGLEKPVNQARKSIGDLFKRPRK
ncbi:AsmA family protein [Pyxidicoccus parkwayensis]|uniref:AsmA family protein n=1 Tax=Pyxidicoccus parkwayensis TaxID=2813578 RepID=UPI001F50C7E5|nr:AsmA family protein [Pyxidicoccus parkwaysis]